ncbi:MAG: methyltransferase domain-containing protein [Anaerolineaceae bacterium]|nr:methyltransferase domain-containing protein [Anaerolineaceae bacterium]
MGKEEIRAFYNHDVQKEWDRLERHPIEWILTTKVLDGIIQAGESVLDLGGGPGRYSLHYAAKGCPVTLVDLSEGNINLAKEKAMEADLEIEAMQGDALQAPSLLAGQQFDHVLVMGPLYHLLNEEDRKTVVRNTLALTKPGGRVYFSFLLMFSGVVYYMSELPEMITGSEETPFLNAVKRGNSYGGMAFTEAFFIDQNEILPFMEPFALQDQHLFGQEGILAQFERQWKLQTPEVQQAFIDLAVPLLERPEFLSYSCHAMLHGKKP